MLEMQPVLDQCPALLAKINAAIEVYESAITQHAKSTFAMFEIRTTASRQCHAAKKIIVDFLSMYADYTELAQEVDAAKKVFSDPAFAASSAKTLSDKWISLQAAHSLVKNLLVKWEP